jgi:hypothetical protein
MQFSSLRMSATTLTAANFAVTLAEETKQEIQELGTDAP